MIWSPRNCVRSSECSRVASQALSSLRAQATAPLPAKQRAVLRTLSAALKAAWKAVTSKNASDTDAQVWFDMDTAGIKLTTSKLTAVAEGLQGVDAAKFAEIAQAAEKGCPISNAIRGSMQITVEASTK